MAASPLILVTGSNGQLGSELRALAVQSPLRFHFTDRTQLALDHPPSIREVMERVRPQFVVNCAAYTAVDKAESEREAAFAINGNGPGHLAAACAAAGARLVHISTDYVFDGTGEVPRGEDEPTGPVNLYGASKLEGEQQVAASGADSIIIRTSWVYSAYGKNFVRTMLRLMGERGEVGVVSDQRGAPTYAADLAEAIIRIIGEDRWKSGLYHYSNGGLISWYDFAVAIRDSAGLNCHVKPITTANFPTPAKRPAFSGMKTEKFRDTFGLAIPEWRESLEQCLQKIREGTGPEYPALMP